MSLICADFRDENGMYLNNDGKYSKYTQININFDKCNSSKYSYCKSESEI